MKISKFIAFSLFFNLLVVVNIISQDPALTAEQSNQVSSSVKNPVDELNAVLSSLAEDPVYQLNALVSFFAKMPVNELNPILAKLTPEQQHALKYNIIKYKYDPLNDNRSNQAPLVQVHFVAKMLVNELNPILAKLIPEQQHALIDHLQKYANNPIYKLNVILSSLNSVDEFNALGSFFAKMPVNELNPILAKLTPEQQHAVNIIIYNYHPLTDETSNQVRFSAPKLVNELNPMLAKMTPEQQYALIDYLYRYQYHLGRYKYCKNKMADQSLGRAGYCRQWAGF